MLLRIILQTVFFIKAVVRECSLQIEISFGERLFPLQGEVHEEVVCFCRIVCGIVVTYDEAPVLVLVVAVIQDARFVRKESQW